MNFEGTQIFHLLPEVTRKESWDFPVCVHPLPSGSLVQLLYLWFPDWSVHQNHLEDALKQRYLVSGSLEFLVP